MPRRLDYPVFDADNHMYETTDAFTKYLPEEYAGLVKYVEVNGRTKIALQEQDQRVHPEPDLQQGRAAGRPGARVQAQEPVLDDQADKAAKLEPPPRSTSGRRRRSSTRGRAARCSWTSRASTGR